MTNIATIGAAFGAVKTAIGIVKTIKDAGSAFQEAEIKLQFADLMTSLAEAQVSIAETQTVIIQKDKEIDELKAQREQRAKMIRYDELYYEDDGNGNPKGDPYCPKCYETKNLTVHLLKREHHTSCYCPECDSYFENKRSY